MIGKKPSEHVQVYRDVIERFEELGRNRRYDHDGMRAEQEEQKRIKRCNQQFKGFCDKVEEAAKENGFELSFDKPAMDLVFVGVPNKQSTNIYPTENCLVSLEDSPAFVIDAHDVEIAHFERVNYSLRNFDLVFVYKDFLKEPKRITTIPRENLDTLQDFLNWKGVLYSTGKMNLDWKTLMGKIRTNLSGFVESGGWDFLLEQDENRQIQDDEYVDQGPAEDGTFCSSRTRTAKFRTTNMWIRAPPRMSMFLNPRTNTPIILTRTMMRTWMMRCIQMKKMTISRMRLKRRG